MGRKARELTPYVSLRHFFGAELRYWRQTADLSYDGLGAQVNYSGDLIGKVEKAERTPSAALAVACDAALGTGGVLTRLVGLIEAVAEQEEAAAREAAANAPKPFACGWLLAGYGSTVRGVAARGADLVRRFEFLVSMFGAGIGSLLGSAELVDASRLGPEDVARWQRRLSRLYEMEAEYGGGGGIYELALQSLGKLHRTLDRASYGPSTGETLHTVAGELTQHVGWLAFDAGRQTEARHWWLDASHTARLIGDDRLLVGALKLMSQQAIALDRPGEAIDLAQAAQQAAKPWGTPRLRSNLLAREALGHARAGDGRATWQALNEAEALFGVGPHDDDPSWLYFWDEADLACLQTCAAQFLGELPLAERFSRTSLAAVRPEAPRNRASYLTHRAEVLVAQHNMEEAVPAAAQAVIAASDVSSARVDTKIGQLRTGLVRYSDQPRVAEFLDWSGQVMAAKTGWSMV